MTLAEKAQVDQHGQAIVQILSAVSWSQGVAKPPNDVPALGPEDTSTNQRIRQDSIKMCGCR
jgi:hypothetical protein